MSSPKRPHATLPQVYAELRRQAARTGEDRSITLAHGARLAVRVRNGETILSVARKGAPVGDREELTFKVNCGVPPGATRVPETGQRTVEQDGATFYQVVYRWREEAHAA